VVFLTVPDDALADVDGGIGWRGDQLVVHCSGAAPAGVLARAASLRAQVAGFHPVQTFADLDSGLSNLPGTTIGIEADDASWPWLAQLAGDLGAQPLRISAEQRPLYHAAASLVSNGAVGLMALGAELWGPLGVDRPMAVQALLPLLRGTVRNLEALGVPDGLTGPIVRGDAGTVARHVEALAMFPQQLAAYRALGAVLIDLATERGTITDDQVATLRAALER